MTTQQLKNNARVTNARIMTKLESMDERLKRVEHVADHVIRCEERWQAHEREHRHVDQDINDLEKDVKKWGSVGGFAGVATALLASLGLSQK